MAMREVFYSCGTCGYPLKLCSSNRSVGSDFKKETKKGLISFASIDETRFKHHDELRCGLYCESPTSWRLHRLKTRLLCGQCEAKIGAVYEEGVSSLVGCNGFDSGSESSTTGQKRYLVKIYALQPDQDIDEAPPITGDKGAAMETMWHRVPEFEVGTTGIQWKDFTDSNFQEWIQLEDKTGSLITPNF